MKFPGAKYGLKMACGENPKRVYAQRGPSTRMGNVAGYRAAWIGAEQYRRRWDKWNADRKGDPPTRDLGLETLAEVLRGNILVHNHCYRADEMAQMIDIADEFGYRIRSFHHGVEAYKIADLLARDSIAASVWADWGAFKLEAADAVRGNLALLASRRRAQPSCTPTTRTASSASIRRPRRRWPKGIASASRSREDDAIKWMTINPAWTLGIDGGIGSLERGKNADVVLWSGNPFSVYSRAEKVWIDGAMLFDRLDPSAAVAHRLRARLRARESRRRTMMRRLRLRGADRSLVVAARRCRPRRSRSSAARSTRSAVRRSRTARCSSATDASSPSAPTSPFPPARSASTRPASGDAGPRQRRDASSGSTEIGAVGRRRESVARGRDRIAAAFRPWEGFNPRSVLIGPTRDAGVTSRRDHAERRPDRRPGGDARSRERRRDRHARARAGRRWWRTSEPTGGRMATPRAETLTAPARDPRGRARVSQRARRLRARADARARREPRSISRRSSRCSRGGCR